MAAINYRDSRVIYINSAGSAAPGMGEYSSQSCAAPCSRCLSVSECFLRCLCDCGVMEQEGESKQQPLLHLLVLGRALGMAGKALDMLRHQEIPSRLG